MLKPKKRTGERGGETTFTAQFSRFGDLNGCETTELGTEKGWLQNEQVKKGVSLSVKTLYCTFFGCSKVAS